jgi:hypothetical protein
MALTSAQAITLLFDNPTTYSSPEALLELARQVSIEASGSVTVLYSGTVGDAHSTDVVKSLIANGTDVRVIDKTEASLFLNSDEFLEALGHLRGCL